MNVNVLQTKNPYINNITNLHKNQNLAKIKNITSNNAIAKSDEVNVSNNISKSEMKYFQKLFPDNAMQIENYVTFNRQAKLVNVNLSKGTHIDGRI